LNLAGSGRISRPAISQSDEPQRLPENFTHRHARRRLSKGGAAWEKKLNRLIAELKIEKSRQSGGERFCGFVREILQPRTRQNNCQIPFYVRTVFTVSFKK